MKNFSRVFAAIVCAISLLATPLSGMAVYAEEIPAGPAEAVVAANVPQIMLPEMTGDPAQTAALLAKIQDLRNTQYACGIGLEASVEEVYYNTLTIFALTKPKTSNTMLDQLIKTAKVNPVLYLNLVNSLVGIATGNPVVAMQPGTPVLTKNMGVNYYGPSGKETYYNMNMDHIVKRINDYGYPGKYWVRADGVKMVGDYVMVGACFDIHPYGSLVQTSLGVGMVVDTGGFVNHSPLMFDIATAW